MGREDGGKGGNTPHGQDVIKIDGMYLSTIELPFPLNTTVGPKSREWGQKKIVLQYTQAIHIVENTY